MDKSPDQEIQLSVGPPELPRAVAEDGNPPLMLPDFMYPMMAVCAALWAGYLIKSRYAAAKAIISRLHAASARLTDDAEDAQS